MKTGEIGQNNRKYCCNLHIQRFSQYRDLCCSTVQVMPKCYIYKFLIQSFTPPALNTRVHKFTCMCLCLFNGRSIEISLPKSASPRSRCCAFENLLFCAVSYSNFSHAVNQLVRFTFAKNNHLEWKVKFM